MIARLLRGIAIVASLLVVAGWALFAVGEASSAATQTTAELEDRRAAPTVDPSPTQERARERAHSAPRELVDDANDVLLSPFAAVTRESSSRWARRSVPAALALLVYGLGLGFLARFATVR